MSEAKEDKNNLVLIPVTIEAQELLGAESILYFRLNGERYCARAAAHCRVEAGDQLKLAFDLNKAHFFDPEKEFNIIHQFQ